MKRIPAIGLFFFLSQLIHAQLPTQSSGYDLTKDKVLYTVGYAHLDSEWNWDYPTTINQCIRNIMTENFHLFEKYPGYVFNFTGSRRYQMMKEYYPNMYEKVKMYIHQGRWFVSGSSVDEGEVNMSSAEALIRQVLYGNRFFKSEFGKVSVDYMLPDCFGFRACVPSIWNHCGLLGFSTQKLTWRSANGVPFNVGIWNGPDGKGIVAALNATDYNGRIKQRLDLDETWVNRLNDDNKKYGINFDYRYYGVGDEGGAPRERDVKNVLGSIGNADSKFKVVLTSSDQMFRDITPEIRKKLPVYSGDLLLIEHSSGSLTSQAFMKRMNRKNEILAQETEPLASVVDWMGGTAYPYTKLNDSWNLVLGSQFHDILPGTSIPKAYEYAWNDEFIAANGFSEVLKNSVAAIAHNMNTQAEGRAIVVYNPVTQTREDLVTAELSFVQTPAALEVMDKNGKVIPAQIVARNGNVVKFIFLASTPSVGLAVYHVKEAVKQQTSALLKIAGTTMENAFYKVTLNSNGDIASIFDKVEKKELLSAPASLQFLHEMPAQWPSWNMDWMDRQNPAIGNLNQDAGIEIVEQGPVRVAFKVHRKGMGSEITQIISLSAGEAGKRVEVDNTINWQSKEVCLKAAFPLTVNNEKATYNLGVGTIQRATNNEVKFEVPSSEWFDLTDQSGKYGVTILEDCKYGSDKPNSNTLRLTLLYTPGINNSWKWCSPQGSQDWGIHHVKYAIVGHKGDWRNGKSQWFGQSFNRPLLAFETAKHDGVLGKDFSLIRLNTDQVGLMAFKKMEEGDYYLVRVQELNGNDFKNVRVTLPGKITDAYEVNGQEQKIGPANVGNGVLNFDITHYTIKSFAVKFEKPVTAATSGEQVSVPLPFNQDVISYDDNRDDGDFADHDSYPAEMLAKEVSSEGVAFKLGDVTDGSDNAVSCQGQVINLPSGDFDKLYILAAADEDTKGIFRLDSVSQELGIQKWTDFIGQYYNREFAKDNATVTSVAEPYLKRDDIAWFASHCHQGYPSKNVAYRYCYLYSYAVNLPRGTKKLILPTNKKIKVFAITLVKSQIDDITPVQTLSDDFSEKTPFVLMNH